MVWPRLGFDDLMTRGYGVGMRADALRPRLPSPPAVTRATPVDSFERLGPAPSEGHPTGAAGALPPPGGSSVAPSSTPVAFNPEIAGEDVTGALARLAATNDSAQLFLQRQATLDPSGECALVYATSDAEALFATLESEMVALEAAARARLESDERLLVEPAAVACFDAVDAALRSAADRYEALAHHLASIRAAQRATEEVNAALTLQRLETSVTEILRRIEAMPADANVATLRRQLAELTREANAAHTALSLAETDASELGRMYAEIDSAGQIVDAEGERIPRAELTSALHNVSECLTRWSTELDGVWSRLNASAESHASALGVSVDASAYDSGSAATMELIRRLSLSVGLREVLPGNGSLGEVLAASRPVIERAVNVELALSVHISRILQEQFGVTLDFDAASPVSDPSEAITRLEVACTTLARAAGLDTRPSELAAELLAASRGRTSESLAAIEALIARRTLLESDGLALLERHLASRGPLTREAMARGDLSLPLPLREAMRAVSGSDTLWRLCASDDGLSAEGLRRAHRYEVRMGDRRGVPVAGFFASAGAVVDSVAHALDNGSLAQMQTALRGLSSAQCAYVVALFDERYERSFAETAARNLVPRDLADLATELRLGPSDHGAALLETYAHHVRYPREQSDRHLAAVEATVEDAHARFGGVTGALEALFVRGSADLQIEQTEALLARVRSAQRDYLAAIDAHDAGEIAATREVFAQRLEAAQRSCARLRTRMEYMGEDAHGFAVWLRDMGAMTAALAAGAAVGAAPLAMFEPLNAAGVSVISFMATFGGGVGAGLSHVPFVVADAITGNTEGDVHMLDAIRLGAGAALGSSLGGFSLASLPARLASAPLARFATLGLAGANTAVLVGYGSAIASDRPMERISEIPIDALRSFLAGGIVGALGGPSTVGFGAVTDAVTGGVEHAIWQTLRDQPVADGMAEAIVNSLAVGSISRSVRLRNRLVEMTTLEPRIRFMMTDAGRGRPDTVTIESVDTNNHEVNYRIGGERPRMMSIERFTMLNAAAIERWTPPAPRGPERSGGYRDAAYETVSR